MFRYSVKVRDSMFLWGSSGITQNMTVPLLLHIRNDVLGEPITFGTESIDGTRNTIGTLQPGESFSIFLQNVRGVFATCPLDSNVRCCLLTPR